MTYQVIARKWRPQTFTQVVGQDHITATLTNALATDRIAHCYLFCGPRGVGKTTTARILAKALNCRSRQGHDPCQQCASCVSITNGTSMDVLEIDGASNNSVDDVLSLDLTDRQQELFAKYRDNFIVTPPSIALNEGDDRINDGQYR